jgi:hypothetical protein
VNDSIKNEIEPGEDPRGPTSLKEEPENN